MFSEIQCSSLMGCDGKQTIGKKSVLVLNRFSACSVLDLRTISNNGKRQEGLTNQEWVRDRYFREFGTK